MRKLHYVYVFTDPRNGEVFYVGKGFGRRMFRHLYEAIRGDHCNPKMQKKLLTLQELGLPIIPQKIFEHDDEWPCHAVEVDAIAFYGMQNLCNLTNGGEGMRGFQHSEETRSRIAEAKSGEKNPWFGKKLSPEHIARMSASRLRRVFSHETRAKIASAHVGMVASEEARAKMSASRTGRHLTDECKKKLSLAKLGKAISEAARKKISAARIGMKASDAARANISASKTAEKHPNWGKSLSSETRAKISAAHAKRRGLSASLVILLAASCVNAHAYILVEDIPNLSTNVVNEVKNYAQYLSQTANQITQITNQVTQIQNQIIALERFGNPQYYVNLLGLSSFMATASVLTSGIGNTTSSYRQAANGALALGYTGNGLYSNLAGSVDRYGNPIRYNTDAFRKFAAVNDMLESYNTQQRTFNAQMASLQQQLTTAMQNLNAARTQMETEKYAAEVNAIHAQINALTQTTNLTGQRAAIQQLSNQNDAARVQEASRQQEIQERQEDLQNEAQGFGNMVGGTNTQGVLP